MNQNVQSFTGLVQDLSRFISGIDEVEHLIGKDCVFHDAEVDDIHICRDKGSVTIHMWTYSDLDFEKEYNVIWLLEDCFKLDIQDYEMNGGSPYVWEMEFELDPESPDWITIIFGGTGIRTVCWHVSILVEETPGERY